MKTKQEPLNPVQITILPLTAHLKRISETFPPDFTKLQEVILEGLFAKLDIERIRIWLDGAGMSDSARKFHDDLTELLTMLKKFGNDLRRAGIIDNIGFEQLQKTNYKKYWGLREQYDEIANYAGQVGKYLATLAGIVQTKIDSKESTGTKTNQSKESLALATLADNPKLSKKDIAEKIGVSRTSLYRMSKFCSAMKILKSRKNELPKGKVKQTDNGKEIEAWDAEQEKDSEN
jgi:DNA-binding MarR family transcriptional regulator